MVAGIGFFDRQTLVFPVGQPYRGPRQ